VGLDVPKDEPRLDVVGGGHVISDEQKVLPQSQMVDHNSLRQKDGRGEEGGARHDALHGPSPPSMHEYGIRREEQEANGVGREAPQAERRGICTGLCAVKTFKKDCRSSRGC